MSNDWEPLTIDDVQIGECRKIDLPDVTEPIVGESVTETQTIELPPAAGGARFN